MKLLPLLPTLVPGIALGTLWGLTLHLTERLVHGLGWAPTAHGPPDLRGAAALASDGLLWGSIAAGAALCLRSIAGRLRKRQRPASAPSMGARWLVLLLALFAWHLGWLRERVDPERLQELGNVLGAMAAGHAWLAILGLYGWSRCTDWTPSRARGRALALVAIAALAPLAGVRAAAFQSEPAPNPRLPNVLLVVVDCLRPDHLGFYGHGANTSPFLDQVAARGRVFERAYSTASWTKPAVASLITGQYVHQHGVQHMRDALPDASVTAAERFRQQGYDTVFIGGGNSWIGRGFNFQQGYRHFVPAVGWSDSIVGRFIEYLDDSGGAPFFAYLHFMDVHMPYEGNAFTDAVTRAPLDHPSVQPGELDSRWVRHRQAAGLLWERDRQRVRALYDAQVRSVDHQLARLVATLGQRGLDDTLLVVTADHGEELWDHTTFGHGHSVRETPMRVPLLLLGPGVQPGRDGAVTSLVDLLPTMLARVGARVEEDLPGRDLLAPAPGGDRPLHLSSTMYGRQKLSVLRGSKKLVETFARPAGGTRLIGADDPLGRRVHDLAADPTERNPLPEAAAPEPLAAELKLATEALIPDRTTRKAKETPRGPEVDRATLERLRTLGYIE